MTDETEKPAPKKYVMECETAHLGVVGTPLGGRTIEAELSDGFQIAEDMGMRREIVKWPEKKIG